MSALVFCALIIGDQCNARGRLGFDAVPCHTQCAVVERGTQMMHGAASQALSHRSDDNVPVTFAQHAGFSDGPAVLQGRAEINTAQQSAFRNVGRDLAHGVLLGKLFYALKPVITNRPGRGSQVDAANRFACQRNQRRGPLSIRPG